MTLVQQPCFTLQQEVAERVCLALKPEPAPTTHPLPLACRLGIIPGAGGTQRLPRLIGRAAAKELIFTCRKVTGRQAQQLGLVDHCVAQGAAYTHALSLAAEMAQVGGQPLGKERGATGKGASAGDEERRGVTKTSTQERRVPVTSASAFTAVQPLWRPSIATDPHVVPATQPPAPPPRSLAPVCAAVVTCCQGRHQPGH
jgi:hypothetical protein